MIAYGPADATVTPSSLASLQNPKRFTFLILAYRGCPGKKVIKQVLLFAWRMFVLC